MNAKKALRRTLVATAIAATMAAPLTAQATTWRGWNIHSQGYPNTVALEHFAKAVTKETHGDITAKVYNNAVLGDQTDAIQQAITGAIQFANFNLSPLGEYAPEANVVSLPFLFTSVKQAEDVMDGPVGDQIAAAIQKEGLVVLSWFTSGARSFYNSHHPIKKPSDLQGMKIRVQNNDLYVGMVAALGGSATPMAFGALYQGLANGVVDGAENNYPSYKEANHYQVAKYYTEDRHFIIPECLCVSTKAWNSISKKDQAIVRKLAKKASTEQRALWKTAATSAKKFVIAHGAEVNTVKNIKPFQDAMQPLYQEFFKKYPQLKPLVKQIRDTE